MDHYFHQVAPKRQARAGRPGAPQHATRKGVRRDLVRTDRRAGARARGDARVRRRARCGPPRARATRRRALPEDFLSRPGSSASSATQLPEAYGGARRGALADHERARRSRSSRCGDAALALAALAPGRVRVRGARPGHRRAEAGAACRSSAASASTRRRWRWSSRSPASSRCALAHASPSRRATRFVLSGAKSFVPLADRASHFLVIARNAQAATAGALDAFIVPRDAAGLRISEPREEPRPARAADRARSSSSASSCRADGAARRRRGLRRARASSTHSRAALAALARRPLARA